jgi:Di-N-acetylchitobiase
MVFSPEAVCKLWALLVFVSCTRALAANPILSQKVVYAFSASWDSSRNFLHYDWDRITDLCLFGGGILSPSAIDNRLRTRVGNITMLAHSRNVRVSGTALYPQAKLRDAQFRHSWATETVQAVQELGLDGINVDIEFPVLEGDTLAALCLVDMLAQLRRGLDTLAPGKQLTFDVAWSPDGIDGRFYDVSSMVPYVNFFIVMAYCMQSQIWSAPCLAEANSPLPSVTTGVQQYLRILPAKQVILGVPWFGYDYPCLPSSTPSLYHGPRTVVSISVHEARRRRHLAAPRAARVQTGVSECVIPRVPFRGAPCSDAAGTQVPVATIFRSLLPKSTTGVLLDSKAHSPFFNYMPDNPSNKTFPTSGDTVRVHQVRFDDAGSLREKYDLARRLRLGGIGFWEVDALDYSLGTAAQHLRQSMFEALDAFLVGSAAL